MEEKKCRKIHGRSTVELEAEKGRLEQREEHTCQTKAKKPKTRRWRSDHTQSVFYRHICQELNRRKEAA